MQNKPIAEQIAIMQQDDGWSVEARVSGLSLSAALSLQTYMLALVAGPPAEAPAPENAGKHKAPDPLPGDPPRPRAARKAAETPPVEVAPPPPPPAPVAEVAPQKPLLDGELGDTELAMRLADAPKLRDVLVIMGEAGVRGTDNLVSTATRIKDRVPVLARIGDLRERITRAAEVLGVA